MKLDATHNLEREGEDESVQHSVDGLENRDVLHERTVPHDTKKECADENGQHEHEKFHECVGSSFGLGYFLNHLLQVDIFFCINNK
tara:strand:+ start:3390 stop:3647 length:258 start_codon:yes stop_codon:yes gene_type:complete